MTWTDSCGAVIKGMKAEHCPECHETFTNTSAGDAHRTGPHDARRCLTPDEMRGREKRPLEQDKRGYWRFVSTGKPQWWLADVDGDLTEQEEISASWARHSHNYAVRCSPECPGFEAAS